LGLSYEQFISDDKTVDAVVRNLQVIGEAADRLPSDFKAKHPGVDWKRVRGFRNRLVHEYFGIDYSIVWNIIDKNLDELLKNIKVILKEV
jgi:uncharacterized protein with HEPN domain